MPATFRVSLPDGGHYDTGADESLLAAAQRAHWLVRYGCRNGNCRACAAELLQGRVQHRDGDFIDAPTAAVLLCLCRAQSDVVIALPDDPRPGSADRARRRYAQLRTQDVTDTASTLYFSLPAGRQPLPHPGQIALIETAAGLLQGRIDCARSHGRDLVVDLPFASPLCVGAYHHVRYPLNTTPVNTTPTNTAPAHTTRTHTGRPQ